MATGEACRHSENYEQYSEDYSSGSAIARTLWWAEFVAACEDGATILSEPCLAMKLPEDYGRLNRVERNCVVQYYIQNKLSISQLRCRFDYLYKCALGARCFQPSAARRSPASFADDAFA